MNSKRDAIRNAIAQQIIGKKIASVTFDSVYCVHPDTVDEILLEDGTRLRFSVCSGDLVKLKAIAEEGDRNA